ncbi:hypothetical protein [Natrinema soli]|uniref:Uncharacterized protein n=1 Tax=Natrinema soli TaxID=1930624 RepID=A0ABD5SGM9_9EURY|nr:hypothetical protein [Natrinema soli]
MSETDDDRQEQETLIVCDLRPDLSIDELHTAKAALTGAGFVLEEDLSTGQLKV